MLIGYLVVKLMNEKNESAKLFWEGIWSVAIFVKKIMQFEESEKLEETVHK